MTEITLSHFDQHYSKYIFKNGMSHHLQQDEENGGNIEFCWINFITYLLLLCKPFCNPKLTQIVISSLIYFTIAYNALSVLFNSVSVIVNLKNSPKNDFFTIEFSTDMHLKLLTISKMKYKSNHLYLKMALLLPGDANLNPDPVTKHQLKDPKFEAFNNKGLHLIHLNINNLLPKIDELHNIAKCYSAAAIGITKTKLNNTAYNSEVTIDRYNIVLNDRNRKGGGLACYIRSDICYSKKTCLSDDLENIFTDILFPKTKPISLGIF